MWFKEYFIQKLIVHVLFGFFFWSINQDSYIWCLMFAWYKASVG